MVEEKEIKETKTKKLADSLAATIDPASQQMIHRAQELGIETAFDRAATMKPCNIGTQGICCLGCLHRFWRNPSGQRSTRISEIYF